MLLSILIPCWNEELALQNLLPYLQKAAAEPTQLEIIVIDGQSTDQTKAVASGLGAVVISSERGRAVQMNAGAQAARGEIFYFLHADSLPPVGYDLNIKTACSQGKSVGCFRLEFDQAPAGMRFFAWMSRFNWPICRGGDQSLFIQRHLFEELGGYNEAYKVYEDCEFTGRIYQKAEFWILPLTIITSNRKYKELGWFYLQWHFAVIHLKHYLKKSPAALEHHYLKYIQSRLG